jgi:glycosyltransferase involved in cell wall biosynthesis
MKFVKYLPENGYLPIVITGPGKTHNEWTPKDNTLIRELSSDVPVYRVQTIVPVDKSRFRSRLYRLLLLQKPFSKWWISSAIEIGKKVCERETIDLIYATMSPFESARVGAYLSVMFKIPWVADLRDAWALDEIQVYPSFIHRMKEKSRMHAALQNAASIIMNTSVASSALKDNFPDFQNKHINTITNGFDKKDFDSTLTPRSDGKFRLVHSGSFLTDYGLSLRKKRKYYEFIGGMQRGVDIATRSFLCLFDALERVQKEKPNVIRNLEIFLIGNISESDKDFLMNSKYRDSCIIKGYLSRDESLQIVRSADLLFLPMHNVLEGNYSTSVPSKIYEYMASGRPILGAVPDGDARNFLQKCGSGFICRPDDVEGMKKILIDVHDAWDVGRLNTKVDNDYIKNFERKYLTTQLAEVFNTVLRNI